MANVFLKEGVGIIRGVLSWFIAVVLDIFELLMEVLWFASVIIVLMSFCSYAMSPIYWFVTDHDSFWPGFKELLWALCPIANIFYVWDWWMVFFKFLWSLVLGLFKLSAATLEIFQ